MSAEGSIRPAPPLRSHEPKSASVRWRLLVVWIILGVIAGYFLLICFEIVWQSRRDEAQPADAIIVFGAAEYSGRPSPVFRARLDHAITLYSRGMAPYLIITGGAGRDPQFSEGGVGRDYLATRGISERHLIAETQGGEFRRIRRARRRHHARQQYAHLRCRQRPLSSLPHQAADAAAGDYDLCFAASTCLSRPLVQCQTRHARGVQLFDAESAPRLSPPAGMSASIVDLFCLAETARAFTIRLLIEQKTYILGVDE